MNDFLSFGSAVATNYGVTFIFQTNLNFHEKPQFYVTSSQPARFQSRTSLEINGTLNLTVPLWGGMSNFAMSAPVLWTVCMSACRKPFPKIVPMAKLHSLLACAFIVSTYNNLLLKAKGRKKLVKLQYVIIYYGEMMPLISFHHSRQIYYGEMIHYDFISP